MRFEIFVKNKGAKKTAWSFLTLIILSVLFLSLSIFFTTDGSGGKPKKLKKLYISSIKANGVPAAIADSVRKGIKLTIFEKYGANYQILDDEAVRVMYKQAAAIMASGCDDESCVTQIAEGINADEIIYGKVSKVGPKLNLDLTNLERKGLSLATKSVVDLSFLESRMDHFVSEAAKKLMNRKYSINMKAQTDFDDKISLKAIKVARVKGLDISVMRFTSPDETISRILSYLKELVTDGDEFYEGGAYSSARDQYFEILEKIKTKLRPAKQKKMAKYVNGIKKRVGSAYLMEYRGEIESIDKELETLESGDIDALQGFVDSYNEEIEKIDSVGKVYRKSLLKLKQVALGRIDSIYASMVGHYEKKGDIAYREYRFSDSMDAYEHCKGIAGKFKSSKQRKLNANRFAKKIKTVRTTGENYLFNKVKLLLDQAEFYNFRDETAEAENTLMKAREAIIGSALATRDVKIAYNGLAKMMGEDTIRVLDDATMKMIRAGKAKEIGGIVFIKIKGGSFMMGSNSGDDDEKPVHRVKVSGFWMSRYEVTQRQYREIMGSNPSYFEGDDRPVEQVSWDDAMEFCRKFSQKHGVKVRLPYEAEWEYACRAGTTMKYYWGDEMDGAYAWYAGNSGKQTHSVGEKKPNAWGLYNMSGNVWEWCMDWYDSDYYRRSPASNPHGPKSGSYRVNRVGSWLYGAGYLRSANRYDYHPRSRRSDLGFRLLRTY